MQIGLFDGSQRFYECKEYLFNEFKNTPILKLESNPNSKEFSQFNDLLANMKDYLNPDQPIKMPLHALLPELFDKVKFFDNLNRVYRLYNTDTTWFKVFFYLTVAVSHNVISVFELNNDLIPFLESLDLNHVEYICKKLTKMSNNRTDGYVMVESLKKYVENEFETLPNAD